MSPFAHLWATFLAWYHDPARILGKFEGVSRRLIASVEHHNAQATAKTAEAQSLISSATAHTAAADRASSVSAKLTELIA